MHRMIGVVAVAWVLSACTSIETSNETVVIDRTPADRAQAEPLTLEEAGHLAAGALIEIYGLPADPVPIHVEGTSDVLDGQTMWRLDLRVDVTVDDQRVEDNWQMWIGTSDTEDATVLRSVQTNR